MKTKSVHSRAAKRRKRISVTAALREAYLRFESDPKTKSFVLRSLPKPLPAART